MSVYHNLANPSYLGLPVDKKSTNSVCSSLNRLTNFDIVLLEIKIVKVVRR